LRAWLRRAATFSIDGQNQTLRNPQRDSGRALRQGRANCTAQFKFGELGGEMLLKLRTRALVLDHPTAALNFPSFDP
jgi:hypothetical protein